MSLYRNAAFLIMIKTQFEIYLSLYFYFKLIRIYWFFTKACFWVKSTTFQLFKVWPKKRDSCFDGFQYIILIRSRALNSFNFINHVSWQRAWIENSNTLRHHLQFLCATQWNYQIWKSEEKKNIKIKIDIANKCLVHTFLPTGNILFGAVDKQNYIRRIFTKNESAKVVGYFQAEFSLHIGYSWKIFTSKFD